VEKKSSKNTIKNLIETFFKAPNSSLQLFSGLQSFAKLAFLLVFIIVSIIITPDVVESRRPIDINFGRLQTLSIFPGSVETTDWNGLHKVLIQDLSASALYHDFTVNNSAYLLPYDAVPMQNIQTTPSVSPSVTMPPSSPLDAETPSSTTDNVTSPEANSNENDSTETSVPVIEVPPNLDADNSQPQPETSEKIDIVPTNEDISMVTGKWLLPSFGLFQLMHLVMTEQLVDVNDTSGSRVDETLPPIADVPSNNFETVVEESTNVNVGIGTTSEVLNSTADIDDVITLEDVSTQPTSIGTNANTAPSSAGHTHQITVKDFGTAALEPGQFINSMQLRMSFAAKRSGASEEVPHIEVLYGTDDALITVGAILVDDEVSNAENGGYFLFGLPSVRNITELIDAKVVIRYHGDKENLKGMFLDAVWIDVETRIIGKADLLERGMAGNLSSLTAPHMSHLVSDKINFRRDEIPVFNLRYDSQRNFIIRGLRNLMGRNLVSVESVLIKHNSLGIIGIEPVLTVTRDGLLTIEIPEEAKEKMRPGTYSIELMLDEGGREFIERFDFQWGILSTNPNKSEYQVGETAHISIGALSPNGNTICKANLNLYATDPLGIVSRYDVVESGLCDGNNVIDVPDFSALVPVVEPGVYELYLERLDGGGQVLGFTTDTFNAVPLQQISIERTGPTRIYPPAQYPMQLTVSTTKSFTGTLTEVVPASFEIYDTDASILSDGEWQWLTWDVSILGAGTKTVSYRFDAPDISPYLFTAGPARLDTIKTPRVQVEEQLGWEEGGENHIENTENSTNVFIEHRRWQIASDAVGNMILFWTDGASIPTDWTCLSCGSGTFFERFAMGSSTYNSTGGALTHGHTVTGSVAQTTGGGVVENWSGTTISANDHSHTFSPTIGTASNLPEYRTLRVIQYTAGAGEPPTIPAGAVAVFDSSVPTGWTRYSAQDGYYLYGADTIGSTGGSDTHTHSITGTVTAAGGGTLGRRGGGTQVSAAAAGHTHTVSGTSASTNNEPPYIEVILGQITSTDTPPNGMISMWTTADMAAGWLDVSSDESDPFSGRFIKGSASYGTTGGAITHSHVNTVGIVTSIASALQNGQSGAFGSSNTHTHLVDVTGYSEVNHLPPYLTVVFAKRIGLDATLAQANYRWYQNTNAQTPTNGWHVNLGENNPITSVTTPLKNSDVIRLRINAVVANATSSVGTEVKLQYVAAPICTSATGWSDVGAIGSGEIWRGFNNSSVTDGSTLSSTLLASSTVSLTYEETGISVGTPNEVPVGGFGEWDFVIQNNGATQGTEYCFRLVYEDDTPLFAYSEYPKLITNASPGNYQLQKRFDNQNTNNLAPTFDFFATDPEANKIDYQIQIASDYGFSSVVVDRDSVSNSAQFENQVLTSEKNPFTSGQVIRFLNNTNLTNGNTYWWRVRGRDPNGSNAWGDWSNQNSFSIDTSLDASGWLQREDEQFTRGLLSGVEVYGSDQVRLITGSSTGTITSPTIDFNLREQGTAWDSLRFTHNTTNGSILYRVEYRNDANEWNLIPNIDLAGNSSGFSSSPVSLLGLDVSAYRFIRIVATLANSGGTPFLQEWAVDWGFRVETPAITSPFANEKVSTTTPTFTFTTNDPQDDSLTYQIEWSTDATFSSGVTTRTSDTNAGFVNLNDGGDTDPFNSGDTILFTVQTADVLTNGNTYWWRVRAKDTTGDDEYSFWTTPRSFTVDNTVTASTWFQTTEQQFESNILSGTTGVSGGVTVATVAEEALIVYGEGTVTTPRYRIWNGSVWSDEDDLLDINSTIRSVVTRAGTTREEYVAATIGANGHVIAQVYSLGEWGDLQSMTTTVGSTATRGFDIAYETVSGRAIVVYCKGNAEPAYRIWNGSTWSAETVITQSVLTSDCRWVQLASDPVSNEIIMALRGSATSPHQALVWNGTTWGNSQTIGTARVAAYEGASIEYEESGDQAIMVAATNGGGGNRFDYITWNGTTWTGPTTYNTGTIERLYWPKLTRNKGTDELVLCYVADNSNVLALRWTGTAWASLALLSTTVNNVADPAVSCVFENTSGRDNYILAAYSDTTATEYEVWNTTTWSNTNTQINSIVNTATMQLMRTDNDVILGTFFDYNNTSLRFSTWNGTSWSTTETLEDDVSVTNSPYGYPYYMAPRNPGSEGTVVVSPPILFTEGLGPYFEEFSWNDTTPGSSDIVYQLQYFNGTSWQFIPNSDLSGNETGFTTGPVDLTGLNISTYGTIRPYATLTCDGPSNCPTLNDWTVTWAEGITISGTLQEYNQVTNVTGGTVAVAVNGVLQIGKTGSVSAGLWDIDNVTVFAGDIVTVFLTGANDVNEAVGVARYSGIGNIEGIELYERHLSLGSNSATTTPLTNANIGLYSYTNTEDIFFSVTGTTLNLCVEEGCALSNLYVKSGTYYTPGGRFITHDFKNSGVFTAGSFTHEVAGSWINNATTTMTGSTIVFSATSTNETVTMTGNFNNVTFGTTTGSATWSIATGFTADGAVTVSRGTLARGATSMTINGNLTTGANGFWTGIGTTTLAGSTATTWNDQNSVLQNVGHVVVDGTNKIVSLAGNVAAQSITIGANDTLDASTSNYAITVYGNWLNQNIFLARSGTVSFAATTTGRTITVNNRAFHNLHFTGSGGAWSFTENVLTTNNNFTVATGTVTLPTATTTIGGSFDSTGGSFAHNNGTLLFTANAARTITFDGGLFTNVAHNLVFNGSGSWTMNDVSATTTNDIRVLQGTVTFPSGILAVGGTVTDAGGTFVGGTGTVRFYSSVSEIITAGGSSFGNLVFDGSGDWSFADTNVDANGDLLVRQGTLTLPNGNFTLGGSYENIGTVVAGSGTVTFDSVTTGKTIDFGASSLNTVVFNSATGGWTLVSPATTTNAFTLTNVTNWTLASGQVLSVGGVFSNNVNGASTTWTGSTLSLEGGNYNINTKGSTGDIYGTLRIADNAHIGMWNSTASIYNVSTSGSLYSQDHAGVDGDLYVWGAYVKNAGTEYWSYATDFDGTSLTGSERQVNVRFAADASATIASSTFEILGGSAASTTIANQGSGTYTINVISGTTTAQYYEFSHLGATGVSFLAGAIVPVLRDGSYTVAAPGGTALSLSSTTIDANPAKQIFNVMFATSTAITASNVTQTDGTPASYWWFRNGSGNLYGETYDNDTGDPGSVRFDDSSLVITVAGTVYDDAGVTPIVGGTCDGSTPVVRIMIDDVVAATVSCSAVDGTYSASGIVVIGDPTITAFLNDASGSEQGSVITRTPTADILNFDIYANRVILRNEDVDPLTIVNLAVFDNTNDSDLQFIAATSTGGNSLTVLAGNELYLFASSTFTPGGVVTLAANAAANSYDGTLYLAGDATFNAHSTSTVTIGGRLELATGATFNAASTTVLMNATTTGKSITAPAEITFNDLIFDGVGGGWNLGAPIRAEGDMTITSGTVTGTNNIYLPSGSLTGNGILSLGGGTTTLAASNTLGGTTAWTFYNLMLGDTFQVGTTTPVFTSTTTISGLFTISAAHYLDAGSTTWDLAGTGTVFVENGTFLEGVSTIRYSGASANVLPTQYYNLDINAGAGSPTYTATGLGLIVDNNLTIGGDANSTFNLNTNDPLLDVNGDVIIRSNGTLSASDVNAFTIAGSYDNDGTFTGNGGTVTFNGTGVTTIAAGTSNFSSVLINAIGDVTITEHATATNSFTLTAANTFTLANGESLAVGGQFTNGIGGGATTWTGSTLRLYGSGNYTLNTKVLSDSYGTLQAEGSAQIRMWNSGAATYNIAATASLYSQDHAGIDGDLYIWGAYTQTNANDHWSYATDFDGASLSGSERKVDVHLASGASVNILGGTLSVAGVSTASTTIQNQGSGSYGLLVGGSASALFNYYEVRNINSSGLVLTGAPTISSLSFGDLEVSQNGGTAMTVGGTVINANPAKNFNLNRFALNGVASGFNVTATGTSVSSWRFVNHYGDLDGEGFDVDPDGDPGYIVWDDSAAQITISGRVYSDEGVTVSSACTSGHVRLVVAGLTSATTTCDTGTGLYSFSNVSYGPTDSLLVYITGATSARGTAVTKEPVSNITNFDIYENRVIVRHENTSPLSIVNMSVWDSSDDADVPFTAVDAATDTLTLPSNTKLLVWNNKQFAPGGNVTVSGGGAGAAYDGTMELQSGATWTGAGTQLLSIGGSFILNSGAAFVPANGTTTFTTTGTNRTIDINQGYFNHIAFTGAGSWDIVDTTLTVNGNYSQTAGAVTFPTGTSTFSGSLVKSGGTFDANDGIAVFSGSGNRAITLAGSDLSDVIVTAGNYTFTDVNATATKSVVVAGGTVTLPSGTFGIGGDFLNTAGTIVHNTAELLFFNSTTASLRASSSDLYALRFIGGGNYTFLDDNIALLDNLIIENNSSVLLASGTTAIGGSLDASDGSFTHATGTILFNASATGKFIDAGNSDFYRVQISAPAGGYTVLGGATTTSNFTLSSAGSFTLQSGSVLTVNGVFTNSVGGANTNWSGSTLKLDGENAYTVNTKSVGGDQYDTLIVGANSDIRLWNSAATTTIVDASASVYSQDHAGINGSVYIFGDFHITTMTEYWSYATDFDGISLTGSERVVTVAHADVATTTVDGGTLRIIGTSGNETTITNQGAGTYAMAVSAGTFQAERYAYRNLNANGLTLSGTPLISSISYGDFELAVDGGTLISLSSTTLNANASLISTGNRFATTTAITGFNVSLTGETSNAWTFVSHTGNLSGEAYDVDGLTACGSVRWNNSACLLTQQTQYRWRNDDGGLGVPDNEWFDTDWDARKFIRVANADGTTYIDAAVQLQVTYDADMQLDFDDLRFTASDGLTLIPHWIGSSTDGVAAEVWVKVPTLQAEATTNIFMYYSNPTAISVSSSTDVFIAADDFEDGSISEYSGQTGLFGVSATFNNDGTYGLGNAGNESGRANLGGIFRFDQTVSQGQTLRYKQYVDTTAGSNDEACTLFGVQSPGTTNQNYAVCIEQFGTDRISLARNVIDNDVSGTILASSTVSFSTGWYEVEVDWGTDDSFFISLYDGSENLVTTMSATDSTYISGGIGFTFWFHHGGWDSISSRPTITTKPTAIFGVEQSRGGATWKAAQNTLAIYDVSDVARLRFAIENSGLAISNQQLRLEYAPLGGAPSCEAVNFGNYNPVPIQSSCGTSPVCMQDSTNVTNGAATVDLLTGTEGMFTPGQVREDSSNITTAINIDQNEYTEVEYVIAPTSNIIDENLCFRVTNNGAGFDTYLRVARLSLTFDPVITDTTLNGGQLISLIPGTTTAVYATSTITDGNGFSDLVFATSTIYRSGVAGGASCVPDNNNCYVSTTANSCQFTNCVGTTCTLECRADIYFHADPTDAGLYEGQEWFAFVEVEDASGGYDFDSSIGVDVSTLRAIDVQGMIDYGALPVNADTGSYNASTTVLNLGNVQVSIEIQGTDLTDGNDSFIPAQQQKFATSTFTYSACGASCNLLSSTTPTAMDMNLGKPTVDNPPVTDDVYWGIAVPIGVNSVPHQGMNIFTPI